MKRATLISLALLFGGVLAGPSMADYCECRPSVGCYFDGDPIAVCPEGSVPYPEGELPDALKTGVAAPVPQEGPHDDGIGADDVNDVDDQISEAGLAETTTDSNRAASTSTVRITTSRIRSVFAPRPNRRITPTPTGKPRVDRSPMITSGIAAGDAGPQFGAWLTPAYAWLENSNPLSEHDGNLVLVMAGLDYKVSERVLLGCAVGYEDVDLDTAFNDGTFRSKGVTITPYAGLVLLDGVTADALFSYTGLDNDIERDRGSSDPVTGDYDSARTLVAANLNVYKVLDNWSLNAVVGYLYVSEDQEEYSQNDADGDRTTIDQFTAYLGEWRIGGRAGYLFERFEPYLAAAYLYDNTWNSDADDRDGVDAGIGIDCFPNDAFVGSVELSHSFLRDDINDTRLLINLRYEF
jgi:hypothetical protein